MVLPIISAHSGVDGEHGRPPLGASQRSRRGTGQCGFRNSAMNNDRVQALDLCNPANSYAPPAIRSSATFYLAAPTACPLYSGFLVLRMERPGRSEEHTSE